MIVIEKHTNYRLQRIVSVLIKDMLELTLLLHVYLSISFLRCQLTIDPKLKNSYDETERIRI